MKYVPQNYNSPSFLLVGKIIHQPDLLEFLIESLEKTVKLSGKHRSLVQKYKENRHIINNDIWLMFYFLFILWHSTRTLHFTNVQAAGQRWYLLLLVWDKFNDPGVHRTSYM